MDRTSGSSSRGRSSRKRARLTPEEQAERTQAAHQMLTDAVEQLATDDDWVGMLTLSQRLPTYSPRNCVLLFAQNAQGLVMGYRAWNQIPTQGGVFCQVARGAQSLKVLAPVTRTGPEADEVTGEETTVTRVVGFRLISVFDESALISPPHLPTPTLPQLLGDDAPARLWEALAAQVVAAGFGLDTSEPVIKKIAPANGRTDFQLQTIAVRPDLAPAQRVKTLAHELAHVRLHHPRTRPEGLTDRIREVEAESVAFLVTAEVGLDSSAYSIPYVSGWAQGDTTLVLSTADRAVTAARAIGDAVQAYLGVPAIPSPLPHAPEPVEPAPHRGNRRDRGGPVPDGSVLDEAPAPFAPLTPAPAPPSGGSPDKDTVTITTPGGRWLLTWRQEQSTFTAHHVTDSPPATVTRVLGALPQDITSMGALEQDLGFALPAAVREHLDTAQAARPAVLQGGRDFSGLYRGDRDRLTALTAAECPTSDSRVTITAAGTTASTTYAQALAAGRPLRRWTADRVSVEILSTDPHLDPELDGSQALTYRLSENGRVIFSGDDILAPRSVDPTSDEALVQVVRLLSQTDDDLPLRPVQRDFLTASGRALLDRIDLSPPYSPGTHIAVTTASSPNGRAAVAGTVQDVILDRDGTVSSYAWRPDTVDLIGHPWKDNPRHTIVSTAGTVRATLADRDVGLTGWTPDIPLVFGTLITIPDSDLYLATIIRAHPRRNSWEYDVLPHSSAALPTDSAEEARGNLLQVPAADLVPLTGTAWDNPEMIVQAREELGYPLVDGEIVAVKEQLHQALPDGTGLALTGRMLNEVIPAPSPMTTSSADTTPMADTTTDTDVVPCATPTCSDPPASTVAIGCPDLPTDISPRCTPCAARVAQTALSHGYAIDVRPLPSPAPNPASHAALTTPGANL